MTHSTRGHGRHPNLSSSDAARPLREAGISRGAELLSSCPLRPLHAPLGTLGSAPAWVDSWHCCLHVRRPPCIFRGSGADSERALW